MFSLSKDSPAKQRLISAAEALPDRAAALQITHQHLVLGQSLLPPFPAHLTTVSFGMGCFWGAERRFWQQPGIYTTAVGYAGGYTVNPTYQDVCSGLTAHSEVVRVVFDPAQTRLERLMQVFWEAHDPTQGMRQGNDVGTQYRSVIYVETENQYQQALAAREHYQRALTAAGKGTITTEIRQQVPFYYAEEEHQQYLAKHPHGYCGLRGTGVPCAYAD
jgi:peptide-methionine (S)-S-oxide reductase